jgi:hypothetical protein
MKKISLLFLLLATLSFTSCEEVVDVNLKTATPQLVVSAAIQWTKGTKGNQQVIKLTTTSNYFDNEIPVVSGAKIYVTNSDRKTFNFIEVFETGEYVCTDFEPVINETYTLVITNKGNTYTATETLKSVAPITKLVQNNNGGFTKDKIEVKAYFFDPPNENNYYLYNYMYSNQVTGNSSAEEDRFFQGNEFFSVSFNDNLKPGDQVEIKHSGISENYYNYLTILISLAGDSGRLIFQTPSATVRGNILNITDKNNHPLGYFSLSEVDSQKYVIK